VSLYLNFFGLYVNWDRLETRKGDWLRRLNACHNRQNRPDLYDEFLTYLVNYFNNYVTSKPPDIVEPG